MGGYESDLSGVQWYAVMKLWDIL